MEQPLYYECHITVSNEVIFDYLKILGIHHSFYLSDIKQDGESIKYIYSSSHSQLDVLKGRANKLLKILDAKAITVLRYRLQTTVIDMNRWDLYDNQRTS